MKNFFGIVFFAAILTAGCGIFTPSESDARAEFEKKWKAQLESGVVKINQFRKTDGQSGEVAGVKTYALDYEAEIEYPNGLNPQCADRSKFSWDCLGAQMKGEIKQVGEKVKIKDKILFEKTENGWRAVSRTL